MNAHAAIGFCLECKANVPLKPATLTFGMLCENCGSNRIERQKAEPVPANPPSSGVSDAPGCGCKVEMRSAKDSMCRIDFIIVRCPLHDAASDLYAALDKLTALLLKPISAQSTAVQLAHVELIERGCEDAKSALAKARGEKPNETR